MLAASVGMVLHVVPDAVGHALEFALDASGVVDDVEVAAEFDPPEVVVVGVWVDVGEVWLSELWGEFAFGEEGVVVVVCPGWWEEGVVGVGPAELEEDGVSHGAAVAAAGLEEVLVEFAWVFASVSAVGAGEVEDAVAGAVGVALGGDAIVSVFVGVPGGDGGDVGAVGGDGVDGGVEEESEVRLLDGEGIEDVVPEGVAHQGVVVDVVELELLEESGLLAVFAVGAADAHADFAGGVAAEDGAVLDEDDGGAVAGGGDGRAESGESAADDGEVGLEVGDGSLSGGFHARGCSWR